MSDSARTLLVEGLDAPGVLASVAGVFARRGINITGIQTLPSVEGRASLTIEVGEGADVVRVVEELAQLPGVQSGVVDALFGAEHDRADDARALATEVLIEDVEPGLGFDVGQVELVAERAADRAGDGAAEEQYGEPQADVQLPVVVAPRT